jgi:hypothetical protein
VIELLLWAIIGAGIYFAWELIKEGKEHSDAKKNPLPVLRKKAAGKKNTAIKLGAEFDNPKRAKGIVYAMYQKKVIDKGGHPKRDKNFDYYEGNAMKIGFTTQDVDVRAFQLQEEYGNRIFDPCIICLVNYVYEVEQKTHEFLEDKELWREMFDVSPSEVEKTIKGTVKELKGAKILNFEKRANPSELFRNSNDAQSYSLAMRRKLFSEGKIRNDPDHIDPEIDDEIPY